MAILHGSWQSQPLGRHFFIWGETWRRLEQSEGSAPTEISSHPFGMSAAELKEFLATSNNKDRLSSPAIEKAIEPPKKGKRRTGDDLNRWQSIAIALPTQIIETGERIPQHSAAVPEATLSPVPWQVEGLCLDAKETLDFLQALPLGGIADADSVIGSDLRFWSHVARWTLDLLARRKFLPGLERTPDGGAIACWQPLLDSAIDRDRLGRFATQMPPVCLSYLDGETLAPEALAPDALESNFAPGNPQLDIPVPQDLLRDFLQGTIDAQVRAMTPDATPPTVNGEVGNWLQALVAPEATLKPKVIDALETAIETWIAPVQPYLAGQNQFRTCFILQPGRNRDLDWRLEYALQAADEPDFLVGAKIVWGHAVEQLNYLGRTIERPQETLLSGLGLASRMYPPIEQSLQTQAPTACRLTPIQAYEFLKSMVWRFQDSGLGVILPPGLDPEGTTGRLGLSIRAESPGKSRQGMGLQSLLDFKWELTLAGRRISAAQFEELITQGSPIVEIDGEWVELRPGDVRAAQAFLRERKDKMSLSLEDALRISSGDSQIVEKLPVVEFEAGGSLEELMSVLAGNTSIEPVDAPEAFRGELRPYQGRGVGWLAFLERWGLGACLADDMGLGKTIQTIAFLQHLQEKGTLTGPILLVCPTSVLGNWEREVKKFGPSLKTLVHHGDKRSKGKTFVSTVSKKNLVVTSYSLVYRDLKDLQKIDWQGMILDEAQNIKNASAKQSQAVRQLEATFRIALTGTPVENRLSELWSILDFLNPGYLGGENFFKRRFAIPIEKYGDTASLETLRSLVQPFILRRLKTDRTIIQDLPEKQENAVFCPLSASQGTLYQKVVDESLANIESAEGIQRRGMVLSLLVKLKQVCNHPQLLETSTSKESKSKSKSKAKPLISDWEGFAKASGKLQRLEEMLEELLLEGDRALIFTQFAQWGKLLQPYLERKFGREIFFLYGSTRKNKREEMVDRFQHDPQGPPIMILSIKAGGTGLNLTRANHVFHYDRWWNPAVENQATDRVFRIGQTRNVQVHKFVCTGTLEEKIHDLIESKKALAEQVVGSGEDWLTELDTDGLRNLLLLDRNAVIEEGD